MRACFDATLLSPAQSGSAGCRGGDRFPGGYPLNVSLPLPLDPEGRSEI
jgi:hypothetical protein